MTLRPSAEALRPSVEALRPAADALRLPVDVYGRGLEERIVYVRWADGRRRPVPIETWLAPPRPTDRRVLERAVGPVLDVGCGPGRHALALTRRSVDALGVDIAPAAIRRARDRGARALLASVFDPLPTRGIGRPLCCWTAISGSAAGPSRCSAGYGPCLRPRAASCASSARPVQRPDAS